MTMQITSLPFQVSGANLAAANPQRNAAAGVQAPDSGQFGATLSRELAQRQAAPGMNAAPGAAAQPNRPNNQGAPAKPQAADKPASQGPKAAAREPAKQNDAAPESSATAQAGSTASSDGAEGSKDAAAAAESASAAAAAATNPVTDMLAFMASLNQPAQATAVAAETTAAAGAGAAGADELQLSALQSAFDKLEGADAAATEPGLASATEGDGAAGFSLASGVQPKNGDPADLQALRQSAQNTVQADPKALQAQAREAVLEAAPVEAAPAPAVAQLQAANAKLDAANPAMPGDRIPARVGTQSWDNQVSQRIVYMVGKEQAATLTLNPPDLGPVQIVLNVSNEQASVAFSSNQLEVRQALENAIPRLREMMSESGIALGNATVDAGAANQQQAQQDNGRRGQGGGHAGGLAGDNGNVATNEAAPRTATRTVVMGDNGMVDTFA